VPDGATAADPASELVLIEVPRNNTDHQGGGMFFHPATASCTWAWATGAPVPREPRFRTSSRARTIRQRVDRDLLSGALRIDVDRRGGAISHPIRRQPKHGHTQATSSPRTTRGWIPRAASSRSSGPSAAQPAPHEPRPGHRTHLRRRRRRGAGRGDRRRRARGQLPVELPRGQRAVRAAAAHLLGVGEAPLQPIPTAGSPR
jgi:hypothetical protein